MANGFRNINYGNMLFESLRYYFSINTSEELSILYKLCSALLSPLQMPFNNYVTFRIREAIIASCEWQIGQLTNVLNYLFDSVDNRIFITQSALSVISDPTIEYPPINWDSDFGSPVVWASSERVLGDRTSETLVTINIPVSINESAVVAVVEQIRIQGIPYQILTF